MVLIKSTCFSFLGGLNPVTMEYVLFFFCTALCAGVGILARWIIREDREFNGRREENNNP